jgi:Protein of unknown function (DUF2842)
MSGLGYRTRRRLALAWLLIGLPVYIVLAVNLAALLGRPGILAEFAIYVVLGIVWALPLRAVFRGVARPDPDAEEGRS